MHLLSILDLHLLEICIYWRFAINCFEPYSLTNDAERFTNVHSKWSSKSLVTSIQYWNNENSTECTESGNYNFRRGEIERIPTSCSSSPQKCHILPEDRFLCIWKGYIKFLLLWKRFYTRLLLASTTYHGQETGCLIWTSAYLLPRKSDTKWALQYCTLRIEWLANFRECIGIGMLDDFEQGGLLV